MRTCDACAHGPRLCRIEGDAYVCEECYERSEAAFHLAADAGRQVWADTYATDDERWVAVARAVVEMYHAAESAQDNPSSTGGSS